MTTQFPFCPPPTLGCPTIQPAHCPTIQPAHCPILCHGFSRFDPWNTTIFQTPVLNTPVINTPVLHAGNWAAGLQAPAQRAANFAAPEAAAPPPQQQAQPIGQTAWQTCGQPIGHTGTWGCTQLPYCHLPLTVSGPCLPYTAGACQPVTQQCPAGNNLAAAGNIGQTGVQYCTQHASTCGNTAWSGCPVDDTAWPGCSNTCVQGCGTTQNAVCATAATVCTQNEAVAAKLGPTGVQYCTQHASTCGNTSWPGCPVDDTAWPGCTPANTAYGCANLAAANVGNTHNPVCSTRAFICPPLEAQRGIYPPSVYCAAPHPAQAAQAAAAPNPAVVGPTGWQGCGQQNEAMVGPTGVQNCTQAAAVCGNTAWQACPPPQAAVTIAPTHLLGCTCLPMTVGPVIPTNNMPVCQHTVVAAICHHTQPAICHITQNPLCHVTQPALCNTCLPLTVGPVSLACGR